HYASDCGAKVLHIKQTAKNKATKVILQFELLSTNYSKSSCKMSYTPKLATANPNFIYQCC
ncbi:MAG: hypothetical protein II612_04985, partial [Prevotella sp.]|nr:hypothetical protein [Prevotella sp.]